MITGPAFSLHQIPFSRQGSWFGISPVLGQHSMAEDLHLVSHQNGMHPVLRLAPLGPADWHATPGMLSWLGEDGRIDAVFETPDTMRLRGRGLNLRISAAASRLTPFSGTYFYRDPVDGALTFTSYETGRRYRITPLAGIAETIGAEALGEAERGVLLCDDWEVALEEMDSSRLPYSTTAGFEKVAAGARAAFADFAEVIAPWRRADTPAAELAAYVLWSATVRPAGVVTRPAVLMSKHWMDKVWSWDHCFNALALALGAPQLARDQYLLPFDHQDESGALPDSITHSEVLYNFVKPPIHGWALCLLRDSAGFGDAELASAYDGLARWTRFWLRRRAPGSVLPHYLHGNDSGWDNATVFDAGQVVVSPDLAAFLILQLDELASIALELRRPDDAELWRRTAAEMKAALLAELWDGDRFVARTAGGGEPRHTASLLHLMPIVLGDDLPAEIVAALVRQITAHLTPYGLATERPDSPGYRPDGYWRGPIWAPATILVEDGLRRAGHTDLADDVSARFRALCEASGFAENFDALTGAGLRDRAYTWTAAAYLLLARAAVDRAP